MSVMALQGCKTSPQKSRPLESGHRRYGVWLAIEYSYKLGQKMNLNFRLVFAEIVTFLEIPISNIHGTVFLWCLTVAMPDLLQ